MLKIVWLPWKFMRLHVAISFEKFFFFPCKELLGERSLIIEMMMTMIKRSDLITV